MNRQPNIIFLHVDQLKFSAVGANGCERVHTPNLDKLLHTAVSFDRSYVTIPMCVPSRTSWYTGLEPEQSGITDNPRLINRDEVETTDLGTWLNKQAGYDCFYMGKWHIAIPPQACGFTTLYDHNPIGEYADTNVARAAENFLLNHRGERPFFLNIGLLNPHDICYWHYDYSPGKFNIAESIIEKLPPLPPNFAPAQDRAVKDWTELQWRFYAHAYYRFVEMVDEEIGRIFRAYQHSPDRENTVFIFASDHGQASGEHGYLTKGTPYEHSLQVPLAIIDPQAIPHRDEIHLISGLDMAPTICDYAGAPPMPHNNGQSFKPLIRGEEIEWRNWLAASTPYLRYRIIYKDQYKLIYSRPNSQPMLFDLAADPHETHDLSTDVTFKPVLEKLLALREQYDRERTVCPMAQKDLDRWR